MALVIFPLLKAVDVFLHLQLQRLLQETTGALSQKRLQRLFGLIRAMAPESIVVDSAKSVSSFPSGDMGFGLP